MPSKSAARPDSVAQAVARQIRTELTARDMDITALIGLIGKRSYVYTRLSVDGATHALTLTELAAIADFLGLTPLDLMSRAAAAPEPRNPKERGMTKADRDAIHRMVEEL